MPLALIALIACTADKDGPSTTDDSEPEGVVEGVYGAAAGTWMGMAIQPDSFQYRVTIELSADAEPGADAANYLYDYIDLGQVCSGDYLRDSEAGFTFSFLELGIEANPCDDGQVDITWDDEADEMSFTWQPLEGGQASNGVLRRQ